MTHEPFSNYHWHTQAAGEGKQPGRHPSPAPQLVDPALYRKARKPWNCYVCARIIYPGQRYVEYFESMYKTYQSGTRFCLEHGIERCRVIDGTYPDPMTGERVKF